jgi:hypothetical protein
LNRVRFGGESLVVERNGEPVCRIEPFAEGKLRTVGDLMSFLEGVEWPDDEFATDLEWIQTQQPPIQSPSWDS